MGDVLSDVFGCVKPVIGMVHLPPLPGSPSSARMAVEELIDYALRDARALAEGGVDGVQVENIGDKPFMKSRDLGFEVTSIVSAVAREVRSSLGLPVGVFVLANGVYESISTALACGASWVRANLYNLAYIADEGFVEAAAPHAERHRALLNPSIRILADVMVKHGSHFIVSDLPLSYHVARAQELGADAIVVSGSRTGAETPVERVYEVKRWASKPVIVGSGLNPWNAEKLLSLADGAIVGTYFKAGGKLSNPVDIDRVKKLMTLVKRLRQITQGRGL
ncbi:MAG: BtpA/SgcQ family protein [Candidatus Caldarchaeum sp.]|uniref:BtpA/SgcQ family protein n=1 Tax=Caldiarchaeum subterraneum TaxID=311458 RepID=A0A7C5Q6G2_CALS0